jgi:hypothetical protein
VVSFASIGIGDFACQQATSQATCPPGRILLGGGYAVATTGSLAELGKLTVTQSRASPAGIASKWSVTLTRTVNASVLGVSTTVTAYAVCST